MLLESGHVEMKEVIFWMDRKAKLEQNGYLWSAGAMKEGLQGTRLERTWDLTMALNFIL